MDEKKRINDLVDMLDRLMSDGGGHINVTVNDPDSGDMTVQTFNSTDCGTGNQACCQPTLHKGFDDDDDE